MENQDLLLILTSQTVYATAPGETGSEGLSPTGAAGSSSPNVTDYQTSTFTLTLTKKPKPTGGNGNSPIGASGSCPSQITVTVSAPEVTVTVVRSSSIEP